MRLLTLMMVVVIIDAVTVHSFAAVSQSGGSSTVIGLDIGKKISKVSSASPSPNAGAAKKYKDDELLVKFKPGTSEEHKQALHKKHGAAKLKEFPELRLHHIKLKKGVTVEEGVKQYQEDPDVEYAEPNFLYSIQGDSGDPSFSQLWGLKNTGQTGGTPGADIKATTAWDITTGSSDVIVAVIDTGIDYTHPDLVENLWVNVGINMAYAEINDPFDDNGHGTHVAGTIGAVGANGTGVVGVNWDVKLTACKFLDLRGGGYTDGAIACLQYIKGLKESGANIVATNNSWGGGSYSQALYDAINAQRDILFIAAAGNNGQDTDDYRNCYPFYPNYPSSYDLPNVIAVAATDHNDNKSVFSNYGKKTVHIGAPGSSILSTLPADNKWGILGGYGLLSGTSMATPHVTGLAALLKAQDPARGAVAIKNLILSGGDVAGSLYGRTTTGRRINAHGSMTCSGKGIMAATNYPPSLTLGTPVTLAALSINCDAPAGPVTVTLSGGEVVTLHDDGLAPDVAAGDGTFSASWTPVRSTERLRFSSPAGSETVEYPALNISTPSLPACSLNVPIRHSLAVSGGYSPYSWQLTWGSPPPGITFDPVTGEISGTPTASGLYSFTVQVTDGYGGKALRDFSLNVNPPGLAEGVDPGIPPNFRFVMDAVGSIYTLGYFFNPTKYDAAGNQVWSAVFTPTTAGGSEHAVAMAVDKEGNVFVGGYMCSTGYVNGGCSVDSYLLVKFDPAGQVVWSRVHPGYAAHDVTTDSDGNVYIAGDAAGDLYYGHLLLIKYDRLGNLVWEMERLEPYLGYSSSSHLTVDRSGNVYLGYGEYLGKYDSSGKELWFQSYDTGAGERGRGIVADADGYLYIAGTAANSPSTAFLRKVAPNGSVVWTRSFAGGAVGGAYAVTLDGSNLYVGGGLTGSAYMNMDALLLKYDTSGNLGWAMALTGKGGPAEHVAVGPTGDLFFLAGYKLAKYDISPPTSTASPVAGIYDPPLTVTLTANEPSTIRYTLDGSVPTAASPVYTGPFTISASTTVRYYAEDSVGHAETPKAITYVLSPTAVVSGTPGSPTNATGATLTVGGSGVVSYAYKLDNGAYSAEIPVAVPIEVAGLGEGGHTVAVRGKDASGLWQNVATAATWTVDLTPPVAVVSGDLVTSAWASFNVGGTDVVAYRYAVDGGTYSGDNQVSAKIGIATLSEGIHVLAVVGRDSAGNWQTTPTALTWMVDGTPVTLGDGRSFRTVSEAYTVVSEGGVIQVKGIGLAEDIHLNRSVSVTFRGGYDPSTGIASGITTLYGSLVISDGTVIVENLIITAM